MVYKFRNGFRIKGDPQVVGERLEAIRERNGGELLRPHVVEDAAQDESPLHSYFEWDDAEAAERYRLEQAGYLIRALVLVPEKETDEDFAPVRAFVCIQGEEESHPAGSQVYQNIRVAMNDGELRDIVLRRARAELSSWRNRYSNLAAFAGLFEQIDEMLAESA